mgnify:CR=1 FL=1
MEIVFKGIFVYNRLTTTEESSSTGYTTYAQVSFINEDDDNEVVIGTGISEDGVHAENGGNSWHSIIYRSFH